ncbi:MAG: Pr6Pr family membrane protein [Anaerolineales bacterium]|nr:Pr6Pr family membrane protein [Anaerolineales bacterium]
MDKRKFIIALRIILGVATIAALIRQFNLGSGGSPANFFSYFTNLTNILLVFVYLSGAWTLIQYRKPTVKQEMLRGGSVVFILVVGLVYEVMLRSSIESLYSWSNLVVHYINPVMALVDWLVYPPQDKLPKNTWLYWLIYPLAYLFYTLLRGPLANWYPYGFLNPIEQGGYGGVALYSVGITILFLLFSALVLKLTRTPVPEPITGVLKFRHNRVPEPITIQIKAKTKAKAPAKKTVKKAAKKATKKTAAKKTATKKAAKKTAKQKSRR